MNLVETLQAFGREGVEFVLVGGLASIGHLIQMKSSAGRDIDRFDIDALQRLKGDRDA